MPQLPQKSVEGCVERKKKSNFDDPMKTQRLNLICDGIGDMRMSEPGMRLSVYICSVYELLFKKCR